MAWRLASHMGRCLLLLLLLCCSSASQEQCPVLRAAAGLNKTGCFVIVLRRESNNSIFETVQSKLLDLSADSRLYGSIHNVAKAITVALNDSTLDIVSWFINMFALAMKNFYR